MTETAKEKRQAQIEAAAYQVLDERGYAGASVLAIAKRAKASNETIYNWYGDKTGLFRALVARNAADIKAELNMALADDAQAPLEALDRIGPKLVVMLTGPRAVALNRAASADDSGTLSTALSELGRGTIGPIMAGLLGRAQSEGALAAHADTAEVLDVYLSLLIGDLQIRRVSGGADALDDADARARGHRALAHLTRIYPA